MDKRQYSYDGFIDVPEATRPGTGRARNGKKGLIRAIGSALLVLDMQYYFTDERSHAFVPNAPTIVAKIKNMMDVFLERKQPVILTRHLNTKDDANLMAKWWKDIILEEDPRSEIIAALNDPRAQTIRKTQYDAFFKTCLETVLLKRKIERIVIAGVMTHLCCETTARSAFTRGFEVFFTVDGTATYNPEFHTATLLNLAHGFATPVLCQEVIDMLEVLPNGSP